MKINCFTCKYGYEDERLGVPLCHHPKRFSEDCVNFNMYEEKEIEAEHRGSSEKLSDQEPEVDFKQEEKRYWEYMTNGANMIRLDFVMFDKLARHFYGFGKTQSDMKANELENGSWDKNHKPSGISKDESKLPIDELLYRKGYEQAEKDAALVPKDIEEIIHIYYIVKMTINEDDDEFYQDVLDEYYRRKALENYEEINKSGKQSIGRISNGLLPHSRSKEHNG